MLVNIRYVGKWSCECMEAKLSLESFHFTDQWQRDITHECPFLSNMNVTHPAPPITSLSEKDFQLWVTQSKLLSVSVPHKCIWCTNATFCSLVVSSPLRSTTPAGRTIESFFIVFFWSPGFCIFLLSSMWLSRD